MSIEWCWFNHSPQVLLGPQPITSWFPRSSACVHHSPKYVGIVCTIKWRHFAWKGILSHSSERMKFTTLFHKTKPFGKRISSRTERDCPIKSRAFFQPERLDFKTRLSNLLCAALGRQRRRRKECCLIFLFRSPCTRKIPASTTERIVCWERNFKIGLQIGNLFALHPVWLSNFSSCLSASQPA